LTPENRRRLLLSPASAGLYCVPVDPDKHLVEVPSLTGKALMIVNALLPNLSGKDGTEPDPPKPHNFMAKIDATLEQNVFDLPKRKRITDIHHHREPNHLR